MSYPTGLTGRSGSNELTIDDCIIHLVIFIELTVMAKFVILNHHSGEQNPSPDRWLERQSSLTGYPTPVHDYVPRFVKLSLSRLRGHRPLPISVITQSNNNHTFVSFHVLGWLRQHWKPCFAVNGLFQCSNGGRARRQYLGSLYKSVLSL